MTMLGHGVAGNLGQCAVMQCQVVVRSHRQLFFMHMITLGKHEGRAMRCILYGVKG